MLRAFYFSLRITDGILGETYRSCRYDCHCCHRRRHRCSASLSKRMGQLKQFLYNSDNGSSFNYVHLNFQINSAIDLFCLWTFFRCCYLYVQSRTRQSDADRPIHTNTTISFIRKNPNLWWNHCEFPILSAIKAMENIYTQWIFHLWFDRCSFCHLIIRKKFSGNRFFSRSPSCKNFVVFRYRNISRSWCWHFLYCYTYAFATKRIRNNRSRDGFHTIVCVSHAIFRRDSHAHTYVWTIYEKRESDPIKLLLLICQIYASVFGIRAKHNGASQ